MRPIRPLALALALLAGFSGQPAAAAGDGDGFVATLWGVWSEADGVETNRLAASVGARQISHLVHMRQGDWRSSRIRWEGATDQTPLAQAPIFPALEATVRDARQRGLAVTLVPFLMADASGGRQTFWPADRAAWFRSYETRLLELARHAESWGVDELIVGSELSLLYLDAPAWRRLIASVRQVFSGHLTISCLWFEYATVQFWSDLDSVGVSGYFPITFWKGLRSPFWLEQLWRFHQGHLTAFARAQGKPLTFSEVGYPATDVAAIMPWDYDWAKRSYDPDLQKACFEAFRRTWGQSTVLRRFSVWGLDLPSRDQQWTGGKGFLPIGKPAEAPLRQMFQERAR